MNASLRPNRAFATAAIAWVGGVVCLWTTIKDGGNAEFYWRPLLALWYIATAVALVSRKPPLSWLRECWWLQLVAPVVLLLLAFAMAEVYEPFPLRSVGSPA